ncbi:hypothetical protein ABEB36_004870 [Hypothenemus hampei]
MKEFSAFMQVCSDHFQREDFFPTNVIKKKSRLKLRTIPSRNLPVTVKNRNSNQVQNRNDPAAKRIKVIEIGTKETAISLPMDICIPECTIIPIKEPKQEAHKSHIDLKGTTDKWVQLDPSSKNVKTREKMCQTDGKCLLLDMMIGNCDKKLNTMTGIPSFKLLESLEICFIKLETTEYPSFKSFLTARHRIMLTFMVFKLNLTYAALAVLFEISASYVKSLFTDSLVKLQHLLSSTINFPSKKEILTKCQKVLKNINEKKQKSLVKQRKDESDVSSVIDHFRLVDHFYDQTAQEPMIKISQQQIK